MVHAAIGIVTLSLRSIGSASVIIPAVHPMRAVIGSVNMLQTIHDAMIPERVPSTDFLLLNGMGWFQRVDRPTSEATGSPIVSVRTPISARSNGNRVIVEKTPKANHIGVATIPCCSSVYEPLLVIHVKKGKLLPRSRRYSEVR